MANKSKVIFAAEQNCCSTVLLASCILGVLFSMSCIAKGSILPSVSGASEWLGAVIVIPSASALILSSSLLGLVLMPVCSFSFGALLYWIAYSSILAGGFGFSLILPHIFAVPAFFLVSSAGMNNSAVLCTAFFKSGTRLRNAWGKRFSIALISVTAATLCAYLLCRS